MRRINGIAYMPSIIINGIDQDLTTHAADLDAHMSDIFQELHIGSYYPSLYSTLEFNSAIAITADLLYATPFPIVRPMTADRIMLVINVAGAAGKKGRLGIYSNLVNTVYPDALLLDAGEIAVDVTDASAITISKALLRGRNWLVFISDGTPTIRACSYYLPVIPPLYVGARAGSWTKAQAYGALPATFPAAGNKNDYMWGMALRFSSLD